MLPIFPAEHFKPVGGENPLPLILSLLGATIGLPFLLLSATNPLIQAWLAQFAQAYAQKPEPEGRAVVIELDEMWHYLKKSPNRSGSGRLGIVLQGSW